MERSLATEIVTPARPRKSRTNVERTAAMRARLISAAIECLHKRGYAASTTHVIAETAKISRGAMLHHFPNKVDLMLTVVEHVVAAQRQHYTEELYKLERGRPRYLEVTSLTWGAWSQPSGIAVIEIMIGARSDPALGERLPPVLNALERTQRDDVWSIAKSFGITDRRAVEASVQLNLAAIRGLCIDLMVRPDRTDVHDAFELLRLYKVDMTDRLERQEPLQWNSAEPPPPPPIEAFAPPSPALGGKVEQLKRDNKTLKLLLAEAMMENAELKARIAANEPGPAAKVVGGRG